jgi:hypothetical protein
MDYMQLFLFYVAIKEEKIYCIIAKAKHILKATAEEEFSDGLFLNFC